MKSLVSQFAERYGSTPNLYRCPGRINIIGEHTDYNDGWCLPLGVDRFINIMISKGATKVHRIYFNELDQSIEIPVNIASMDFQHQGYISPIFELLEKRGFTIEPVDMLVTGNIPVGAGMSSSAALCVGALYALNDFYQLGLDKKDLALIAQQVENEYRGVNCGLLDQLSVIYCTKKHALHLHPASTTMHLLPFEMPDHQFVLVNSMQEHELASTEYNKRRQESELALAFIKNAYPEVNSFSDLIPSDLIPLENEMDPVQYKRAMHVVSENQRVALAAQDIQNSQWLSLGTRMFASHYSLKNHYQVSCTQLDFLVERAEYINSVIGSRMMGGGFGGCTINLVEKDGVEEFSSQMKKSYQQLFKIEPEIYIVQPANGVEKIELNF